MRAASPRPQRPTRHVLRWEHGVPDPFEMDGSGSEPEETWYCEHCRRRVHTHLCPECGRTEWEA